MLTDNRIKLLDFHLVRHVFLILRGRIVVTRSRRRYELNLVSHRLIPLFNPLSSQCVCFSERFPNRKRQCALPVGFILAGLVLGGPSQPARFQACQ